MVRWGVDSLPQPQCSWGAMLAPGDVAIPQSLAPAYLALIPAGANPNVDKDGWSDSDNANHGWAYLGQTDNFHPPNEPETD